MSCRTVLLGSPIGGGRNRAPEDGHQHALLSSGGPSAHAPALLRRDTLRWGDPDIIPAFRHTKKRNRTVLCVTLPASQLALASQVIPGGCYGSQQDLERRPTDPPWSGHVPARKRGMATGGRSKSSSKCGTSGVRSIHRCKPLRPPGQRGREVWRSARAQTPCIVRTPDEPFHNRERGTAGGD